MVVLFHHAVKCIAFILKTNVYEKIRYNIVLKSIRFKVVRSTTTIVNGAVYQGWGYGRRGEDRLEGVEETTP